MKLCIRSIEKWNVYARVFKTFSSVSQTSIKEVILFPPMKSLPPNEGTGDK